MLTISGGVAFARQPHPGWNMDTWRNRDFHYEQVSIRNVPFGEGVVGDVARIGDNWVGGEEAGKKKSSDQKGAFQSDFYVPNMFSVSDFYLSAGGEGDQDNRIYCAAAVPVDSTGEHTSFPVLFVFHGGGGHASGALALALARKNPGCAAVAIDYNGQFTPTKGEATRWITMKSRFDDNSLDLTEDPLNFRLYHIVQASRRVIDWVETQSWCDSERLGCVGISYGGTVSFILAGVDERIKLLAAMVSAGGFEGDYSQIGRHQWIDPQGQGKIWLEHFDPINYADRSDLDVFMELSSNDRFFWLSGAYRHKNAIGPDHAKWLVTPNADHHVGGPVWNDASPIWIRSLFFGGDDIPRFSDTEFFDEGKKVRTRIDSKQPISKVYLAWSAGNSVSCARYWLVKEAIREGEYWTVSLPEGHHKYQGTAYFTVIDSSYFASSSDMISKMGENVDMQWKNGCLWDIESGADAWRTASILTKTVNKVAISASDDLFLLEATQTDKPASVITNSFVIKDRSVFDRYRGLSIQLNGQGTDIPGKIILSKDYSALNAQYYEAEIIIPAHKECVEVLWSDFQPVSRQKNISLEEINGLALWFDHIPEHGIKMGEIRYQK